MNRKILHIIKRSTVAVGLLLCIACSAFAELKTFEKEYTYHASDEDSKNSCRTIVLREVKRLLLEELGTYLESITEVKNFHLTKDQITTLTAGIVKTEIMDERWDTATLKYWLKARITADPVEVVKSIDVLRKDRDKTRELEETRRRSEELARENERLRKELLTAKGEKKQETVEAYNRNIRGLNAVEISQKGYSLYLSKDYRGAIGYFDMAIEIDPNYATAYFNRGTTYGDLSDYQQAIRDYDKAIELNPNLAEAYTNRGDVHESRGNHQQALDDRKVAARLGFKPAQDYLRQQRVDW